jgi:hypothetical protein
MENWKGDDGAGRLAGLDMIIESLKTTELPGGNSPVRKINFTPNRSQNAVADNGHLALPPGNSVVFSV